MSRAKMTLTGFYNYLDAVHVDLFEGLQALPAGISKDTLESFIMLEGGEFECLYGDPYLMKNAIPVWLSIWNRTFEKWYAALQVEYEPLYNYDRHEEWDDDHTGTVTDAGSGSHSVTGSGSDHREQTATHSGSSQSEAINQVSAYDVNDFANKDKTNATASDTATDEVESDGTNSSQESGTTASNNLRTNALHDKHRAHIYGNIGVTTSQQMLESELQLAEWNLYQHITDLFLKEFCVMVYE